MTPDIRIGDAFQEDLYAQLVERAAISCFKWNLAAGDQPILAKYPLLIPRAHWNRLLTLAETLERESQDAERELLHRPELHRQLGIPQATLSCLSRAKWSNAPRYTRFDFHITYEGYRITESNCDVAGGLLEASGVGSIFCDLSCRSLPGDPAAVYAQSFLRKFGSGARIGLAHLTRYSEDRQVVLYFGQRLVELGLTAILIDPSQIRPGLRAVTPSGVIELDALYRFFPGDWFERLPLRYPVSELFQSERISNPLTALLVQSKRFPLIWGQLRCSLPAWREFLPQTVEPRGEFDPNGDWVIKPALGHEGTNVAVPGVTATTALAGVRAKMRRSPHYWVSQRKFDMKPVASPDGHRYVSIGVFVVDGQGVGCYARLSAIPFIDGSAQEAIVLVEDV
jgi:glutathionylspermidine synthase